ncbi:hypothetical protein BDV98DRAFT_597553 [Pterulicium gracile]|uniref:Uncharacterized protein n=1 Tax=Pterulicium gracile TaxID=1884261 RepID=A0A5C3Q345_9AGAR|nr:hypothetical protein BDV98DRAFT_597553 [Pterula gracilis]
MKFIAASVFGLNLFLCTGATVLPRQGNISNRPTCGTTGDAVLADCRKLLDNWPAFPDWNPTCHYGVNKAWNPVCEGGCCVYTDWDGALWADVKNAVSNLMGCASEEKNAINGVIDVVDTGRVCVGDRAACGDCFED